MLYLVQVYLVVLVWVLMLGVVLFASLGMLWLAFRMLAVLASGARRTTRVLASRLEAAAELEVQIQRRMAMALERFQWR